MMSRRLLTAAAAGNTMGKTTQGVVEPTEVRTGAVDGQALRDAFDALRRRCPDLTPEQTLAQLLEQRHALVPDSSGDVRLGHGGHIVVVNSERLALVSSREDLEAAIESGRLLVDERHVVEPSRPTLPLDVLNALKPIDRPRGEPETMARALSLAAEAARPNRQTRRKAQRDARRKQRRSR